MEASKSVGSVRVQSSCRNALNIALHGEKEFLEIVLLFIVCVWQGSDPSKGDLGDCFLLKQWIVLAWRHGDHQNNPLEIQFDQLWKLFVLLHGTCVAVGVKTIHENEQRTSGAGSACRNRCFCLLDEQICDVLCCRRRHSASSLRGGAKRVRACSVDRHGNASSSCRLFRPWRKE